jgi:hypothetical protein
MFPGVAVGPTLFDIVRRVRLGLLCSPHNVPMMLDDLLLYRVGVTRKSRRYGGARKRTDQRCIMLREMSYT